MYSGPFGIKLWSQRKISSYRSSFSCTEVNKVVGIVKILQERREREKKINTICIYCIDVYGRKRIVHK